MRNVSDKIKQALHKPIHEELHELRKTTTQKDLAKILGSNPTTIGLIMNADIAKVGMDALVDIGSKLGIEMSVTTSADGADTITKLTS